MKYHGKPKNPNKMAKNVKRIALADIAEWMRTQNIRIKDEHGDVWVVNTSTLSTPEQTKLNKELGVNKVNYTKEAMSRNSLKPKL